MHWINPCAGKSMGRYSPCSTGNLWAVWDWQRGRRGWSMRGNDTVTTHLSLIPSNPSPAHLNCPGAIPEGPVGFSKGRLCFPKMMYLPLTPSLLSEHRDLWRKSSQFSAKKRLVGDSQGIVVPLGSQIVTLTLSMIPHPKASHLSGGCFGVLL